MKGGPADEGPTFDRKSAKTTRNRARRRVNVKRRGGWAAEARDRGLCRRTKSAPNEAPRQNFAARPSWNGSHDRSEFVMPRARGAGPSGAGGGRRRVEECEAVGGAAGRARSARRGVAGSARGDGLR